MSTNTSSTKCPKCGHTNFELIKDAPANCKFYQMYIRCSSCKSFLDSIPYEDINTKLNSIMKHMGI